MVSATQTTAAPPPPLPPSVEEAYRRKCIDLRLRLAGVEKDNDILRTKKIRLGRGIKKMRLQRTMLLQDLGQRMKKNGADGGRNDEDSEDSSESPPTPQERPLRTKKSHRRIPISPPPGLAQQIPLPATTVTEPQPSDSPALVIATDQANGTSNHSPSAVPSPTATQSQSTAPVPATSAAPTTAPINPRPQPPTEMYFAHLNDEVLPSDPLLGAEIAQNFDGDIRKYSDSQWLGLSDEQKQVWHKKYEDAMREYTIAEDARKKERRQRARAGGNEGQNDVEMGDATAAEAPEASAGA